MASLSKIEKLKELLKNGELHLQELFIWSNQVMLQMEVEGQHTSMMEDYDDLSRQISLQKEVCKKLKEELLALL